MRRVLSRRDFAALAGVGAAAQASPAVAIRLELPGRDAVPLVSASGKPVDAGPLQLRVSSDGVSIEAYAREAATFNLEWRWQWSGDAHFYSWRRRETERVALVQDTGEPGKRGMPSQLFPFAAVVANGELFGALGECPGFWENRSQQYIDPSRGIIALRTGDGSSRRTMTGIWGDSSDFYRGEYDGWQHLRKAESRRYQVWTFRAPVPSREPLYAVRLASHRALAAAKGWNTSALEAILRNNAYLQIRRNLLRSGESRYIITSGVTYGWKQWASDAAMAGLGLGDPEILAEAMRGLFWDRLAYEDNAQWYLIVSAVFARAGFRPNMALCKRCWEFLKDHESPDGAYLPPRLNVPNAGLGWRTYMDLFFYEDGDAPTSNQGFHCGAMMAARELGLGAGEADIARAGRALAAMFNERDGGYFPTSARRQEVFGGDALYGVAVTYAAFGRKCLPDEMVQRHCRHAIKIQSKYGLRVVSKANGDLLEKGQYGPENPHGLPPEKAGAYVQGGSWFFCDAGTWLAGLAYGLEPRLIDRILTARIQTELSNAPAFSESINTRTGEPHGNLLYAANALYLWLRREIRGRLGHKGPDPVNAAVDRWLTQRQN